MYDYYIHVIYKYTVLVYLLVHNLIRNVVILIN